MPNNENRNSKSTKYQQKYINRGLEDEMEVTGYRRCMCYEILSWLGIIFSLGFLRLLFSWIPKFHLVSTHKRCDLQEAEKLLVTDFFGSKRTYYIEKIINIDIPKETYQKGLERSHLNKTPDNIQQNKSVAVKDVICYRKVLIKKLIYIWMDARNEFFKLSGIGPGLNCYDFYDFESLNEETYQNLKKIYGTNEIIVPIQSYFKLILIEITNPYYVFQIFSIIFWASSGISVYSIVVVIFTLLSIAISVWQIRKAQEKLSRTVHASDMSCVRVKRSNGIQEIFCKELVPGDMMVIESNKNFVMPCDAVLLSGTCVVNESMLTGESVPLTKTALPKTNEVYQEKECNMHILYSGTKVIQTRRDESDLVMALVIRTGYSTAKGNLVRSILYPPPVDYKFENGVYRFIVILGIVSGLVALVSAGIMAIHKEPVFVIITKAIILFTDVIPASLPGAMTLSKIYSVNRLKKDKIFCINSRVVNVAGSIDCVCFDKTGTITEDSMDVWGVVPVHNACFHEPVQEPINLSNSKLKYAMASCHSLSLINDEVTGDPLEEKMFQSTGWMYDVTLKEAYPTVYSHELINSKIIKIKILHQYQFLSTLQRMSTVVMIGDEETLTIFCKGSPEMIASLSKPESVPQSFGDTLHSYTKKGFRVLALGCKSIQNTSLSELKAMPRSSVENGLEFLGFLVLENRIKSGSREVIKSLNDAKFKIVLITGDNIDTAVHVAENCGIVSETTELLYKISVINNKLNYTRIEIDKNDFYDKKMLRDCNCNSHRVVLTGNVWEEIKQTSPEMIPYIVSRAAVYARMSGEQKQQIILKLQQLGFCVMMCGDGANDCGALKAANVGISLTELEASVASPLTSARQDISCSLTTIREGRAALTTSFSLIKFLIIFCLIQCLGGFICNYYGEYISDYQYTFEDIVIVVHFALFFGRTHPFRGPLASETPLTSIVDFSPLFSIVGHLIISAIFELLAVHISHFDWFMLKPYNCHYYNNYTVYIISLFQIIMTAVSVSQGVPYRKPLYTNFLLLAGIILVTTFLVYTVFFKPLWFNRFLKTCQPSSIRYSFMIVILVAINFITSLILEKVIIEYLLFKRLRYLNCLEMKSKKNTKFGENTNSVSKKFEHSKNLSSAV